MNKAAITHRIWPIHALLCNWVITIHLHPGWRKDRVAIGESPGTWREDAVCKGCGYRVKNAGHEVVER